MKEKKLFVLVVKKINKNTMVTRMTHKHSYCWGTPWRRLFSNPAKPVSEPNLSNFRLSLELFSLEEEEFSQVWPDKWVYKRMILESDTQFKKGSWFFSL